MKEHILKLKERWVQLANRERKVLILGGAALIFFAAYQLIWAPIFTSINDLRKKISTEQSLLGWMQTANQEMNQFAKRPRKKSNTPSLMTLLSETQKEIQILGLNKSLKQLKQINHQSIAMHFQKAPFDEIITLLINLNKNQSVDITQMTVNKTNVPGLVNAEVILVLS